MNDLVGDFGTPKQSPSPTEESLSQQFVPGVYGQMLDLTSQEYALGQTGTKYNQTVYGDEEKKNEGEVYSPQRHVASPREEYGAQHDQEIYGQYTAQVSHNPIYQDKY